MKREEIICTVVDQNALQVALLYAMYGARERSRTLFQKTDYNIQYAICVDVEMKSLVQHILSN